jgi:hypothetical protein
MQKWTERYLAWYVTLPPAERRRRLILAASLLPEDSEAEPHAQAVHVLGHAVRKARQFKEAGE